ARPGVPDDVGHGFFDDVGNLAQRAVRDRKVGSLFNPGETAVHGSQHRLGEAARLLQGTAAALQVPNAVGQCLGAVHRSGGGAFQDLKLLASGIALVDGAANLNQERGEL